MSLRIRFFLWHLIASILSAILSMALVFVVWYPSPLHLAVGVTTIFLILLGVDAVLGPLLTFLVAKEGKKTLKFDFIVIVILQLSAFIYGMYTVVQGRPVWLVFNVDRFDLVQAYQVEESYRGGAKPEYQKLSLTGPKVVAARKPVGVEAQNKLVFESMGGVDLPMRPDLYVPYEEELERVRSKALPLSDLKKYNQSELVEKALADWPNADAFLPMMSKVKSMSVLINKETGSVVAVVPLNPWN